MSKDKSCMESRMADLAAIMDAEESGEEAEDLPPLNEYGLSFDYVEADTFEAQPEGYFRYQFSYGGPTEELRIYGGLNPYRVEFWLLDWGDGAKVELEGEYLATFKRWWDYMSDIAAGILEKAEYA